jgi:hypothetical protein
MTIDQATDILYEEASRQGIPVNRFACESMARKILLISVVDFSSMKPGDIAQHHRTRYQEDQDQGTLFQE